ncbi:protein SOB FIVE-LIKE 3-like [Solanum lycopersicum]|uniref:protein SOB FIVE-LIKE 3-like n=1 Tax=Solanum lycopersicum TaxID=4081 RepID=UPI000532DD1A|nr:histone deacetylase HDT1-like [Solanum lycopersicum]
MDPKSHIFNEGEECHSSESGWTMYIGSPTNDEDDEMNCEGDFDDEDGVLGQGRRKKIMNVVVDDDDDDDDTDDSMASDASSGPSHHIVRNANKSIIIPKEKGNGNNKASLKKGSGKNQDKGRYSVFSAKVPSSSEKVKKSIWKGKGK